MNGGQNYLFIFKTAQIGVVPYRLWGFLRSQTLRRLMLTIETNQNTSMYPLIYITSLWTIFIC